jgi:hypothetical protein
MAMIPDLIDLKQLEMPVGRKLFSSPACPIRPIFQGDADFFQAVSHRIRQGKLLGFSRVVADLDDQSHQLIHRSRLFGA